MNNLLTVVEGRALDQPFAPERAAFEDAKQRAAIDMAIRVAATAPDEAKKLLAWDMLEIAADALVANQIDFCKWWNTNVRQLWGRPKKNAVQRSFSLADAERLTGITQKRASKWRKTLGITEDELGGSAELIDRYIAIIEAAAKKKAGLMDPDNHLAHGTGLDEWFTPESYVETARAVLGAIDLDPASHPIPQEWIQAERFFTAENNALAQEWHGRIWLNPPYSRDLIADFVSKLVAEIGTGRITGAIVLTHAYTDTTWWQQLAQLSPVIAFPRGRIRFVNDIGQPCNPTQGQTFFGCGKEIDIKAFRDRFAPIGSVRGV